VDDLKVRILEAHQEIARSVPGARSRLEGLQRQFREGKHEITRYGGDIQLVEPGSPSISRSRPAAKQSSKDLPYGHPSNTVEIHRHSTEPTKFSVSLTPNSRRQIEEEIRRIRKAMGDVEAHGWLWASRLPRDRSEGIEIVAATHSGDSAHGRYGVQVGDPLLLRENECPPELRHLRCVGDFHTHTFHGSTVPSDVDAKAWAGTLDRYGLSRFMGVIVTPAEHGGWMIPHFSGWTVRRSGVPSRPVCQPARLVL
jgi:hypothetical protein